MAPHSIDSADVSVIVQGPVTAPTTTNQVIGSIRQCLPRAEIIFSTWLGHGAGIAGFDICRESSDPGNFVDLNGRPCNYVRQAVSTYAGLMQASRLFSLKLRTDTPLANANLCVYDDRWIEKSGKPFLGKLVMPSVCVRDPLRFPQNYSVCDIAHFGLTQDLQHLWRSALSFPIDSFVFAADAFRPNLLGNYVGYSRIRSVPEQSCLIAVLNESGTYSTPIRLNGPCDMTFENFVRARSILKRACFIVPFSECGVILPRRTWSPWFVRRSFVAPNAPNGGLYLGNGNDRALWLLAVLNKYCLCFGRASFWAATTSHVLFRFAPLIGKRARAAFHGFRGDRSFGSEGRRA
jgi:hypothetical protein